MKRLHVLGSLAVLATCAAVVGAATINVGPSRTYTTVQAGVDAAGPGDTILIDGVTLTADAATATISTNNLTIKGSTGTVLNCASATGGGGLAVSSAVNNVTFDSLDIQGTTNDACIVSNASGTTTINNCTLHDCYRAFQILGTPTAGAVAVVTNSHIYNGSVDGVQFCRVESNVASFTLKGCWIHNCWDEYMFKVYSHTNYIMYNRLGDEPGWVNPTNGGTPPDGQMMDIVPGGLTYVIGNVLQNTTDAQSGRDIIYYLDGSPVAGYSTQLYAVYNTCLLRRNGTTNCLFFPSIPSDTPAYVADNICVQDGAGTLFNGNVVNNSAMINSNLMLYLHQGANPPGFHSFMYDANGYDGDGHTGTPGSYVNWDVLNVRPLDPNMFPYGAGCSNASSKMPLPNGYQTVLNPGAGIWLLVPGTNPFALPAYGSDGTSLTPTRQFIPMPQIPGAPCSTEVRPNATDAIGAYSFARVPPPPFTVTLSFDGAVPSYPLPYIYEGWTFTVTASVSGGTPPYTCAITQFAGQPATPIHWTDSSISFTVPWVTSVANEILTFKAVATDSSSPTKYAEDTASVQCFLCGDVDRDNAVILADLKLLLVRAWNSEPGSGNWYQPADLDNSLSVNLGDLKLLVAHWNRSVH